MSNPESSPPGAGSSESRDPLLRMTAYRLACELVHEAWQDAEQLRHHPQPVLGHDLVDERVSKLEQIRRLLLATIPRERGRLIRPTRQ